MEKKVIIETVNIHKSFNNKNLSSTIVLNDLSSKFYRNEFSVLMGASGVGKSTLLYILGSLDKPDKGKIIFNINEKSISYNQLNDNELSSLRNKHIGFVFQFHHLLPEFTALENVIIPALINKISKKNAIEEAKRLLDFVGMSHRINHKPSELSGGEQQRIAIARALINKPSLLIADEPTGSLDSVNSKNVLDLMMKSKEEFELSIIVATHSNEVASVADRVLKMSEGKIVK